MSIFDPSRPVMTRDGRPARIICTDFKSETTNTIIAVIQNKNKHEEIGTYNSNGEYYDHCPTNLDLINIPVKRSGWINIYRDGGIWYRGIYSTKEEAVCSASNIESSYITTIPIEWTE